MSKRGVRLISGVSNNKPTARDYHERIEEMSVEGLKRYIKNLENYGTRTQYLEDCYAYAKAHLPIAIKKEAKKKIEAELKEQEKLKQKKINNQKLAELHTRKQKLLKIGNATIRESILEEYKYLYSKKLRKKPEDKRTKIIEGVKDALSNIDFTRGQIRLKWFGCFKPMHLIYLTDKDVILINDLYENVYLYYSPVQDSQYGLLHTVSPDPSSPVKCLESVNKIFQEKLGEPTLYRFSFKFLKNKIAEYYLFYEERKSQGTETTNIQCIKEKMELPTLPRL